MKGVGPLQVGQSSWLLNDLSSGNASMRSPVTLIRYLESDESSSLACVQEPPILGIEALGYLQGRAVHTIVDVLDEPS